MADGPAGLCEEILPSHCTTRAAPARAPLPAVAFCLSGAISRRGQDTMPQTLPHGTSRGTAVPPGPSAPAEHPKLTQLLSPRAVPSPTCRGNRRQAEVHTVKNSE